MHFHILGRRQAVRQRTLTPSFGCSNHFAPAKKKGILSSMPFFLHLKRRARLPALSGVRARNVRQRVSYSLRNPNGISKLWCNAPKSLRPSQTKRFALRHFDNNRLSAKDDVDNVGAGRAAKGANHFAPAVWVFAREMSVSGCLTLYEAQTAFRSFGATHQNHFALAFLIGWAG